jgi:Domain of unknown function (DUF929)
MSPDEKNSPTGGNKPKTGGNTPKPPARPGGTATQTSQSAKERSKAQSRPVSGKAPSGKSGTSSGAARTGGNKPKPGGRPVATAQPRRFSGAMMAWVAVGLVVVIVGALLIVKVVGGNSSSNANSYTPVTAAPASVVHDVTNIPLSVYNTIGINSQQTVNPPLVISGQPPMTLNGKSPGMLYYGAEYCPFCAAERWPITAALSRFGTWSGLKITASSHTDTDPITHTFSYYGATLTSPYLTFKGIEAVSNTPTPNGYYKSLMTPTKEEARNINYYYNPKFIPGATAGQVGFPFVNIDNKALISGPSYDPGILSGLSWSQIASGLDDPTNPVTQPIVATANYISASICSATKQQPSSVCMSSGVQAAAKALKLG